MDLPGLSDSDLLNVNWSDGGRVHNWRNYVGTRVRVLWANFTDGQRRAIAEDADDMAGQEDWE